MQQFWLDLFSKSIWALLCFVCGLLLTQIRKLKKSNKDKDEAEKQRIKNVNADLELIKTALRHNLRSVLISDYEKYKERGWCTHLEKEEYTQTYDTYHRLHGNGVVTHKNEEVLNLPDFPSSRNHDEIK